MFFLFFSIVFTNCSLTRGLLGTRRFPSRSPAVDPRSVSDSSEHSPILVDFYERYLVDQDSSAFIKITSERYTVATLQRLAIWGKRMTRRAAVLALGFLAEYETNSILGRALLDRDRGVRTLAETAIRNIWLRVGNESQRQFLRAIQRLNNAKRYEDAAVKATSLIHESPWLAEAWNLRGFACFHSGDFEAAIRDCHQALEINPYHFAAATGMGHSYLKQSNLVAALEAYRRALRLNPNLEDVRAQVVKLQRTLRED